ncbi:CDT1 domain containing protein, partial [Asbolus verrucosus]
SPQKLQSPEKPYLSPKKESSVRRNLLGVIGSPNKVSSIVSEISTKEIPSNAVKQGLKLPYKYRTLTEIFRAIDTVSQILYNRKEVITLVKLKPAVEEMLKKTLTRKHLAQIKYIYPNAYDFRQEKLKQYGNGIRQEEWNLVVIPNIETTENMTSEILLKRRRKLYETLIELVKNYHNEFLLSLNPPMIIEKDQITRWHPEFDIEKVPDIEESNIPQTPVHEKFTTGKEVLEKARQIFNCNTRMEQALAKLKAVRGTAPLSEEENPVPQTSILKGIPKALLEKVRQKQVAKALVSMTRSVDKDKEVQLYCRLPEIARFTRSVFVSEKKCVLQLDMVAEKLGNSYRCFLNKTEIEDHLRVISREIPEWLEFHEKRNSVFLKLNKNADLSVVINKLEKLAKEKSEF